MLGYDPRLSQLMDRRTIERLKLKKEKEEKEESLGTFCLYGGDTIGFSQGHSTTKKISYWTKCPAMWSTLIM